MCHTYFVLTIHIEKGHGHVTIDQVFYGNISEMLTSGKILQLGTLVMVSNQKYAVTEKQVLFFTDILFSLPKYSSLHQFIIQILIMLDVFALIY